MTENRIFPTLFLAVCFVAACMLPACSDDPASPEPSPEPAPPLWQEVDLGEFAGESFVVAVDFTGNHGVAMRVGIPDAGAVPWNRGVQLRSGMQLRSSAQLPDVTHEFFRLQPDSSWLEDNPDSLRSGVIAADLAVDATGKLVLAGTQTAGLASVVVDLRGAGAEYFAEASLGMTAVDGEGAFMVAGGRSSNGGTLWTSTAPGNWNFDTLPLTGTNDSGFRDVYIRGDRAVACGYDDGADTLQVILTRTTTTGWEKVPLSGTFGRTFYCVALSDSGTIFVGGIEGAGGRDPRAFLMERSADGHWSHLSLPVPILLQGIMDILIASDGSMYLACQGEGSDTRANLVHADASGMRLEGIGFPGGLHQVGEAANGDIYTVGFRRDVATGLAEGVMLVRRP